MTTIISIDMRHLITLLCVIAMTVAAQAQMVYSTATDGFLNIREQADANAYIIDILYTGGPGAKFLGKQGKWIRVEHNGQRGYVNAQYATVGNQPPKAQRLQRALYYVVISSYDSLDNAKAAAENLPDALLSPVYQATENGTTHYRICTGCFYTREKAIEHQQQIKDYFSFDSWVWVTKGFAECAYRPGSLYDGAISISPLTPR